MLRRLPFAVLLALNVLALSVFLPAFVFRSLGRAATPSNTQRFAVLPLQAYGAHQAVASYVTQTLAAQLSLIGQVPLVPNDRVMQAMTPYAGRNPETLPPQELASLATGIGARYLVLGAVNEYLYIDERTSAVSLTIRTVDGISGNTVWTRNFTRRLANDQLDQAAQNATAIIVRTMLDEMQGNGPIQLASNQPLSGSGVDVYTVYETPGSSAKTIGQTANRVGTRSITPNTPGGQILVDESPLPPLTTGRPTPPVTKATMPKQAPTRTPLPEKGRDLAPGAPLRLAGRDYTLPTRQLERKLYADGEGRVSAPQTPPPAAASGHRWDRQPQAELVSDQEAELDRANVRRLVRYYRQKGRQPGAGRYPWATNYGNAAPLAHQSYDRRDDGAMNIHFFDRSAPAPRSTMPAPPAPAQRLQPPPAAPAMTDGHAHPALQTPGTIMGPSLDRDASAYHERSLRIGRQLGSDPVRPDDAFQVKVVGHDELTRTVRIAPEETFSFPYIEDISTRDMTVPQLEEELQKRLRKFIVQAKASVKRLHQIKVLGDMGKQGIHEFTQPPFLLELLAQAGGTTIKLKEYNRIRARVFTREGGTYVIDVTQALETGRTDYSSRFYHGDTVVVSPVEDLKVYVIGAIKNAVLYRSEMRLLDAIVAAGGVEDEAKQNIKSVRVLRREANGKVKRIVVNLHDIMHRGQMNRNIAVKPGDVIIVPKRSERWNVTNILRKYVMPIGQILLLNETINNN